MDGFWRRTLFWLALGYGVASAIWAVLGVLALLTGQATQANAVNDLVFRIVGAVVALFLAFFVLRPRPTSR